MANRAYAYQYETSPRKLEPEYKKTKPNKKKSVQKRSTQVSKKSSNKKKKTKQKIKLSFEARFFMNSIMIFITIFAIIACQALVNQRYKEKESLKQEYNELLTSFNGGIDSEDDVRFLASEYGMQTKSATLINLGISDYIESSKDEIDVEDENILNKIINLVKNIF